MKQNSRKVAQYPFLPRVIIANSRLNVTFGEYRTEEGIKVMEERGEFDN